MRLRDHIAVFEREPDFKRFLGDPSGSVLHILRIWVAFGEPGADAIRHYVGSIRRCECGGWMSQRELRRLFQRATITASHLGENARTFRGRLRGLLRDQFGSK